MRLVGAPSTMKFISLKATKVSPLPVRLHQSSGTRLDCLFGTLQSEGMKISVELSDAELRDVIRVTGEKQKGPAIRKLVINALLMRRRAAMTEKFMTGEWAAEFPSFEKQRALDRKSAWKS